MLLCRSDFDGYIGTELKLDGTYVLTLTGMSCVYEHLGKCGDLTDAVINISDNNIELVRCYSSASLCRLNIDDVGVYWYVDFDTALSILNEQIASQTVARFELDGPEYVKAIAEMNASQ